MHVGDLVGKTFGELTVLRKVRLPDGKFGWECCCTCGKIVTVARYVFKQGQRSCGCVGRPDITGQVFGDLTVIGKHAKSRVLQRRAVWDCRCVCGRIVQLSKTTLQNGSRTNCGCQYKKYQRADLTGRRFGRLTVREYTKTNNVGHYTRPTALWDCVCDCGNKLSVESCSLQAGLIKSCGCLKSEISRQSGLSKRDLLRKPFAETTRKNAFNKYCTNAVNRGLEWNLTFEQFSSIALSSCYYCGAAPKEHRSKYGKHATNLNGVDRVDNKKGYTPDNCVPCCCWCNHAKKDLSKEEFLAQVKAVANYNTGRVEE